MPTFKVDRTVDRPEYVQVCSIHLFTLVMNATYAVKEKRITVKPRKTDTAQNR